MRLHPYCLQVAGKTPFLVMTVLGSTPLLKFDNGKVAKPVCSNELEFYDQVLKNAPLLAKFVPRYSGKVAIDPIRVDEASQEALEEESKSDLFEFCLDGERKCGRKRRNSTLDTFDSMSTSSTQSKTNIWSYGSLVRKMGKRKCKIMRESSISEEEDDGLVYIVLEDVTNKIKRPCILDLKVGTQQHSPREPLTKIKSKTEKCRNSTSSSLGLRLCGMRTYFQGEACLKDKYFGRSLDVSGLKKCIRHFVTTWDGASYSVNKSLVKHLSDEVEQLIAAVKNTSIRFFGCSLLIAFPNDMEKDCTAKPKLKVIDFANALLDHFDRSYDVGFVFGLNNLKSILLDIMR